MAAFRVNRAALYELVNDKFWMHTIGRNATMNEALEIKSLTWDTPIAN